MLCFYLKMVFEIYFFLKCGYVKDGLFYCWLVNCGFVFFEVSLRVKVFYFFGELLFV